MSGDLLARGVDPAPVRSPPGLTTEERRRKEINATPGATYLLAIVAIVATYLLAIVAIVATYLLAIVAIVATYLLAIV
ncbi:MAG: hypothetical protein OEY70_03265, partial [Acidimicrobiia bacterium]|nr:hypothetical protein [Acidimicrobiia bacterium]